MKVHRTVKIGMVIAFSAMMFLFTSSGLAGQSKSTGRGKGFIQHFDQDGDGKVSQDEFSGSDDHFTRLDQDGDGYVSENEAPQGPPRQGRKGGNFIQDFDKDNDGKVSLDEFPGPDDHFAQFDQDGDGYLSEEEAPKGPPPKGHGR